MNVYCDYPAIVKNLKTAAKFDWKVDRETSNIAIVLKASARYESSTMYVCMQDEYSKNLSYHQCIPLLRRKYDNYRISVDIYTYLSMYMYLYPPFCK